MTSIQGRVRGLLLGLAAGDRNGGPIRMAVRLAESLAATRTFDPIDIGSRYLEWWAGGAFDTGPVAARALELGASGMPLPQAARRVDAELRGMTAGVNPAHRATPLAMLASLPDERLAEAARAEAVLTHAHPLAGDASAASTLLCRALIHGREPAEALELASPGRLPETLAALQMPQSAPRDNGGFSPRVLAAAVYFLMAHDGFKTALDASLAFAGPANYCPVLVGSLAGARWGAADGPELSHHAPGLVARIEASAEALARGWP